MAGYAVGGATRLASTLRKAGADLKQLKPINREAAEIALVRARELAPDRSGALRRTLRVGATNRAGILRAGNNRTRGGVPYAGVRHWGWPTARQDAAHPWRDFAPMPFLLLAARETEPRWVRLYENYADRILNKVKGA